MRFNTRLQILNKQRTKETNKTFDCMCYVIFMENVICDEVLNGLYLLLIVPSCVLFNQNNNLFIRPFKMRKNKVKAASIQLLAITTNDL